MDNKLRPPREIVVFLFTDLLLLTQQAFGQGEKKVLKKDVCMVCVLTAGTEHIFKQHSFWFIITLVCVLFFLAVEQPADAILCDRSPCILEYVGYSQRPLCPEPWLSHHSHREELVPTGSRSLFLTDGQ